MSKSSAQPKQDNRFVRYLKDTRAELTKVVWPTRQEGLRLAGIVLLVTVVSTIFLYGVDLLFSSLVGLLLGGAG